MKCENITYHYLVVDQRPSGIDPEILSQIGTKIVAQLNDEKDIQATLTGVNNAAQLRTVLAGLETKKQAFFLAMLSLCR